MEKSEIEQIRKMLWSKDQDSVMLACGIIRGNIDDFDEIDVMILSTFFDRRYDDRPTPYYGEVPSDELRIRHTGYILHHRRDTFWKKHLDRSAKKDEDERQRFREFM